MRNYMIEVNSKLEDVKKADGKVLAFKAPLSNLREMFPNHTVQRGNSYNWTVALWDKDTNRHLYYIVTN